MLLPVVGVNPGKCPFVADPINGSAENDVEARVRGEGVGRDVDIERAEFGRVERPPNPFLARLQGFLGLLARGDVARETTGVDELFALDERVGTTET